MQTLTLCVDAYLQIKLHVCYPHAYHICSQVHECLTTPKPMPWPYMEKKNAQENVGVTRHIHLYSSTHV